MTTHSRGSTAALHEAMLCAYVLPLLLPAVPRLTGARLAGPDAHRVPVHGTVDQPSGRDTRPGQRTRDRCGLSMGPSRGYHRWIAGEHYCEWCTRCWRFMMTTPCFLICTCIVAFDGCFLGGVRN